MNKLFFVLLFNLQFVDAHELELDQIIIKGHKLERPSSLLEASSVVKKEVISKQEMAHKNATSLASAVNLEPGVQTTLTCANCGSQRITLNGLRGENTTVLIDGIPAFSSVSSFYGMEAIPLAGIGQIEIMRGAGASLTAPEAIGGAINIVTLIPNENKFSYQIRGGTQQFLNQELIGSYGDARKGTLIALQSNMMGSFDEDKNNVAESSRQDQKSAMLKQDFRIGDRLKFTSRFGIQDLELIGGVTNAYRTPRFPQNMPIEVPDLGNPEDVNNKYTGNPQKIADLINLNRVDGGASFTFHASDTLDLQASVAVSKQKQKSIYSHGYDYSNEDHFRFYDFKGIFFLNDSHLVTIGLDHKNERMISKSEFLFDIEGMKADSFKFETHGLYLQDEWMMSDQDELNLVLRVDQLNVKWDDQRLQNTQLKKTAIAPRVHYKRTHDNSAFSSRYSYGMGYRAPLSMFESEHGTNEHGFELNIDKLEFAHNFTYTLSYESANFNTAFSYAFTNLENMAYGDDTEDAVLFQNSKNAYNIQTLGLVHVHKLTDSWNIEASFDWFIMPSGYKEKLPSAAQETRARIISDYHFKNSEFVSVFNFTGPRNLAKYGYDTNYNTKVLSATFEDELSNQKRQRSPLFMTVDLFYKIEFKNINWMLGVNNLFDYTQTKKGDSPLSWKSHDGHAHLDNTHIWGPNQGRVLYSGLQFNL